MPVYGRRALYRVAMPAAGRGVRQQRTATATATAKALALLGAGGGPGWCGMAGDAVNPQSGPAAGGCAFGHLRSSASQAKRPHPWGLGRRLLVCAVLRTRQDRGWASCPTRPRHASGPCGSHPCHPTPPRPRQVHEAERMAKARAVSDVGWRKNGVRSAFALLFSFPWVDARGNCQRPGGWAGQGCPRHGCRGQAPMDGFTASPAQPTCPDYLARPVD